MTSTAPPGPPGAGSAAAGPAPAASGSYTSARGLTGRAAVLVALALSLIGLAVDAATGQGLAGPGFAVGFSAGCTLAALLVRRRSLRVAVFAPPLLFAALALAVGLGEGSAPRTLPRQAVELFTHLILGAPVLVAGTALALLVAAVRVWGRRRDRRRPAPRAARAARATGAAPAPRAAPAPGASGGAPAPGASRAPQAAPAPRASGGPASGGVGQPGGPQPAP